VAWSKIQAVSVASSRPRELAVLLIDLLANWTRARPRSSRASACAATLRSAPVLGIDGDAKRAFAALAARIAAATRGQPLPGPEQALGNPFARFDNLADYERTVLEVAE
jgi:hypothetical protein